MVIDTGKRTSLHKLKGNMNMNELIANYSTSGYWDLDEIGVDLKVVHNWWVKWDTLYIQREKNGDIKEYEGGVEQDHEYMKHPMSLELNGEEIH